MDFAYRKFKKPTTAVQVCPIGDIQWTSSPDDDVAVHSLKNHIAYCESLPNPLYLGLGDYVDMHSPSQRGALQMPNVRFSTLKEVRIGAKMAVERLYEDVLQPTRDKWLGLLTGHHMFGLGGGDISTDHYLADLLGTRVLGDPENIQARGCVMVGFRWEEGGLVRIYAHHGCGGSVYPHGPVLKLVHTARHWDADVFLIGHQSKQAVAKFDMIKTIFPGGTSDPYLDHQTRFLVGTGAWSRGYREGSITYVEEAMLSPAGVGAPVIEITPTGSGPWKPNISIQVR